MLRKVCSLFVFLTYVYQEARFRECKMYLIFRRLFTAFCPCFPQKSEKRIYFQSFWDYFTDLWAHTKHAL